MLLRVRGESLLEHEHDETLQVQTCIAWTDSIFKDSVFTVAKKNPCVFRRSLRQPWAAAAGARALAPSPATVSGSGPPRASMDLYISTSTFSSYSLSCESRPATGEAIARSSRQPSCPLRRSHRRRDPNGGGGGAQQTAPDLETVAGGEQWRLGVAGGGSALKRAGAGGAETSCVTDPPS